jgi:acyl transferase domain-containing protein
VAVAVGIASAEYNNYIVPRFSTGVSAYSATGGALSVASGRLSYTFGFRGPAVSVDTACSSSLVAAHLAAGNVFAGVCSGGLTAGAGLLLSPDTTAMFHKAGMLAADGRCKTLDAAADGYVRGEAVGAVLMQALQGLLTGSLAVFVGSAVNQDGRSSSLTAPNGPSQQEVARQVLAAARLAAADVAQVQMHGTGTPLGDPIEAGAAAAVLVDGARRALPLSAFTSKAWLGHTEAAAGVMGLTHSTAALSHRLAHGGCSWLGCLASSAVASASGSLKCAAPCNLPNQSESFPTASSPPPGILHLTALNSHVSAILEMSAAKSAAPGWHLPRMATPAASGDGWTVCGISSFAFQGTNAHALLRQADVLAATGPAVELATLSRHRVWLAPPVHAMLQAAAAAGSARFARKRASAEVALEAALSTPCLAFLWQHTVLGMAVFPATAFLEMAAGATRQLINSNDLSGSSLRSAVFATPLTLPAAPAAAVRVRCTVQAAAGAFEVSSAAAAGAGQRSHFYASLTTAPANTSATAGQPRAAVPASHLALLPAQKGPLVARLAVAEAIVPPEELGMSVHPAVSEAAMHVAVAHQSQPKQLRVASKMAAVAVQLVLSERSVWASSLVAGAGAGVRAAPGGGGLQEQQLLGVGGLAMRVSGMETRRLVSQVGEVPFFGLLVKL